MLSTEKMTGGPLANELELIATGKFIGIAVIDAETYRKAPGANWSTLRVLKEKSPFHAQYLKDHPEEQTAAMALGEDTHCAILEPERFKDSVALAPDVDRRTKEGKATWEAFVQTTKGKRIIRPDDYGQVVSMVKAVRGHNVASKILSNGAAELSIFWNDKETGLLCKARIDYTRYEPALLFADLKTTDEAGPGEFSKTIYYQYYHAQLAFYQDGLKAVTGKSYRPLIVAVEKKDPHAVATYLLSSVSLAKGRQVYREALETYRVCKATNTWPSYPESIQQIDIPEFALT